MIKPCAIDHIVLRTDRYQELIKFYCRVLGCEVERVAEDIGLTQLRAGNSLIDIVDQIAIPQFTVRRCEGDKISIC